VTRDGPARAWLLAIDTATSRIVVAAGAPDGRLLRALDWPAAHRHGERLLPGVEQLLAEADLARADLSGIVVGTGPGAFTGLRVGLATAKALAHATGLPIAGVGTGDALMRGAVAGSPGPGRVVLMLPAGPHDRVIIRDGEPAGLLPGGIEPALGPADVLVAVDLAGRAPDDAVARGEVALDGLAVALLELGAARLVAGNGDDAELLVPEYVTLPRGVHAAGGEIEWSHGPR
jgi:tRNA threonylcarbamoyl adenosine modification protein YeaZ